MKAKRSKRQANVAGMLFQRPRINAEIAALSRAAAEVEPDDEQRARLLAQAEAYEQEGNTRLTLPTEEWPTRGARQLRAAAAIEPDGARREELLTKAVMYEQSARELASRRAVDEHTQPRRSAGGVATGADRALEREGREAKLFAEAAKIWKEKPRLPTRRVAEMLAEREGIEYHNIDDIRQRIAHLRPLQK